MYRCFDQSLLLPPVRIALLVLLIIYWISSLRTKVSRIYPDQMGCCCTWRRSSRTCASVCLACQHTYPSTHLSINLRNTPIDYIDPVYLNYRALRIHERKDIPCLCFCFGPDHPSRTGSTYSSKPFTISDRSNRSPIHRS